MKYKKGKIYTSHHSGYHPDSKWIWMCNSNTNPWLAKYALFVKIGLNGYDYFYKDTSHGWKDSILATSEEKEWLLACIEANTSVSKPITKNKIQEIW